MSEVLAPGGSLNQALWALKGGADAIYAAYGNFSARSHAKNLTEDEMAKLCGTASKLGARVYLALNTLVKKEELGTCLELAWKAYFSGVSAIIVQDLGLASLLRHNGPPLELHASTQAAIHTLDGLKMLYDHGFSRAVLARELSLSEITRICAGMTQIECEVFVHGALCYSVSGNCLASGLMLGRSANRGDCGQICRTWFANSGSNPPAHGYTQEGYFASMKDLAAASLVRELRDCGVASLKIEGRMKPPAYAYWTSRAYKAFLANNDAEGAQFLEQAQLSFGRNTGRGWLEGPKAKALTSTLDAGSLGLFITKVLVSRGTSLEIKHDGTLSLERGDGILLRGKTRQEVHRCSISSTEKMSGGRLCVHVSAQANFLLQGCDLYLISKHDGKSAELKPGPAWRLPLDLSCRYDKNILSMSVTKPFAFEMERELEASLSVGGKSFIAAFEEIVRKTGCNAEVQSMQWELAPNTQEYVNPGLLKDFRRSWFAAWTQKKDEFILDQGSKTSVAKLEANTKIPEVLSLQARAGLVPQKGPNSKLGFVASWKDLCYEDLAQGEFGAALPLAPFFPKEEEYKRAFFEFCKVSLDEGRTLYIGVNNLAQLRWLAELKQNPRALKSVSWFIDWAMHAAQEETVLWLSTLVPDCRAHLPWVELQGTLDKSDWTPPLFISRACMLRNSLQNTVSCPSSCRGSYEGQLTQGNVKFDLVGLDCITYMLRARASQQPLE